MLLLLLLRTLFLTMEDGQFTERSERAGQRRVDDFVVEVWIGGDPGDERPVEERRSFSHCSTGWTTDTGGLEYVSVLKITHDNLFSGGKRPDFK